MRFIGTPTDEARQRKEARDCVSFWGRRYLNPIGQACLCASGKTMATCDYCDGEMLTVTGCKHRRYTINGLEYPAVLAEPLGPECHDCGALNDEPHHPGCDMETCPHCGGQLISCGHAQEAFDSMQEQ